jgi:hypothetical protein
MDRTTERSEFESLKGKDYSILHIIQTASRIYPKSYPMGTGVYFPGGKAAGA